jgi:hypothetical protein
MVRRAAPATPKKTRVTAVVGGADVFGDPAEGQRSVSAAVVGSDPAPVSPRRHASLAAPARRSELMGIFAGAARDVSPSRRIRHASSQYFGPKASAPRENRLSTIVDAVLDPEDALPEPALVRLRPRGGSDSSIRSAVMIPQDPHFAHDAEPVMIPSYIPPAQRYSVGTVAALAESLGSGFGSLGSLGRKIYGGDEIVPKPEAKSETLQAPKEATDTDAEADAEAEGEVETPRPRRVRRKKRSTEQLARRSSERLAKSSAERLDRLAPPEEENLAPPGARTPTPSSPLRAPRTPSRTALAPSLAIPATVAGGTSPVESAGGLLERLAEDGNGLRSLSLRGSARAARKWR